MKSLRFALKQIAPLSFSYFFIGIAVGILMHEAGYSPIWSVTSSLFIYAGSMQIVMISLMKSGVPLFMIAIMTFFINGRHIFYGIGFIEKFRKMGGWKYPYMALTMTDETYSVLCSIKYPDDVDEKKVDFYIQFICHMFWVFSAGMGALAGEFLPFDAKGVDFSAIAFFTVVVVNQWLSFKSHIPVITGFLSAIAFYFILGADNFILPALSFSMIALIFMREKISLKMGGDGNV